MREKFLNQFATRAPAGDLDYFMNRAHQEAEEILGADDAPQAKQSGWSTAGKYGNQLLNAFAPLIEHEAFGTPMSKPKPPTPPQPPPKQPISPWVLIGAGAGVLALVGIVVAMVKKR